MRLLTNEQVTTPSHQPQVVHMIQNISAFSRRYAVWGVGHDWNASGGRMRSEP